jgi:ABC-type transport system involved in cytochrome c biogenesis permease subunit
MYPLHPGILPWFRDERNMKLYLRLAFLSVLMTYFGCNYLLTGMHSYAGT